MSSFGIRWWIDVPNDDSDRVKDEFAPVDLTSAPLPDAVLVRFALSEPLPVERVGADDVASRVADLAGSRAVVAEHHGPRGATTTVIAHNQGAGTVIYRRHVLGADPHAPGSVAAALAAWASDPRERDITGPAAAVQVAELFEIDPSLTLAADADESAWSQLDTDFGPFPMVRALIAGLDR